MKLKITVWILVSIMLSSVTAWAGLSKTEVSQLYVAIFGRASEGEGNSYWQSQSNMATAAAAMLDTQAARDYFGANLNTNQAFIEHIYLNTLNKTIADDFDGIMYWVNLLNTGTSRGEAVASLVGVIKDYAPGAPYYNPNDTTTVAAYNQFKNRVEVSNFMAENVNDTPDDWETSTSFSHGLVVTDDPATVFAAMTIVNGFTPGLCGAYVAPGVWKEFDCYNLAAIGKTTNDDPFTPSWRLIGGYWQWGRKGPDENQWYDTNTQHFAHGPTGPNDNETNDGSINNWDHEWASAGAWSDTSKTVNDPCPDGYRIPTKTQWDGVLNNNTQTTVGSWSSNTTDYSSARFFGSDLLLPATGHRGDYGGELSFRGRAGAYWSSSEDSGLSWGLNFDSGVDSAYMDFGSRATGLSVRCISDTSVNEHSGVIYPVADSHVYAYTYSGWNEANWGKYNIIGAGWNPIGGEKRAYLKFDVSGIEKETFQKATLKLFHYHTGGGDEAELGVYTVRSDWNEGNGNYTPAAQGPANVAAQGEICWINQPQSDPNPVAYFNPGTTINDFVEVDITPLVNSWINGMENHGLAIKTGENYLNGPESMYGFYSREHEEMDKRPQLIINETE